MSNKLILWTNNFKIATIKETYNSLSGLGMDLFKLKFCTKGMIYLFIWIISAFWLAFKLNIWWKRTTAHSCLNAFFDVHGWFLCQHRSNEFAHCTSQVRARVKFESGSVSSVFFFPLLHFCLAQRLWFFF